MGEIISLNPENLRPTQDYLREHSTKRNKKTDFQFPVIIGRDICFNNEYFIIDGHHNSINSYRKNQEVCAWVAENSNDLIKYSDFPSLPKRYIDASNKQIKSRFNTAQFYVPIIKGEEVLNIKSLNRLLA